MAKKKIESKPIENLGDTYKLTIQKSKPLFALWQSELTLAEFKILDMYLGRINSHDDEHRTVKFHKGELEELLGMKQLKTQVLDERLKHLMTTVRIPDASNKRGFTRIALFEKAHAEQDDYGLWEVELTCTESAKKYIFDIENLGYLRYKLKNIINLKSRYSYILFLYIWENKYRGTWEIALSDLKIMLHCENEETYKQFKRFNDLILKKAHREIQKVTDIRYEYETIKKGRFVVAVRFIYMPTVLEDIEADQLPIEQLPEDGREDALWYEAVEEFNFTTEQLEALKEVLICIPEDKMPQSIACVDSIEIKRYHYMRIKVSEIKRRKNVKNRFPYLLKMLKQDAEIQ